MGCCEACVVYLDDVIIVGQAFQEHPDNLRNVFYSFQGSHLKLNPKKCQLFQNEVWYLERTSLEEVAADSEKLKTVWESHH
jgi:hypothetical protein